MSLRPLIYYPNPLLRQVCADVLRFDGALHALLEDMAETMSASKGIGLAAPQVGILQRIAVIDVSPEGTELIELINPVIKESRGKVPSEEGCLSIPDYRDTIDRNESVSISAVDRNNKPFQLQAEGIMAICIQHEIDHLNGILFVDRLSRLKRGIFKKWFQKHNEV